MKKLIPTCIFFSLPHSLFAVCCSVITPNPEWCSNQEARCFRFYDFHLYGSLSAKKNVQGKGGKKLTEKQAVLHRVVCSSFSSWWKTEVLLKLEWFTEKKEWSITAKQTYIICVSAINIFSRCVSRQYLLKTVFFLCCFMQIFKKNPHL